jgi:hypothetical protein
VRVTSPQLPVPDAQAGVSGRARFRVRPDLVVVLLLALSTVGAILLGDGDLLVAFAPALLAIVGWAAWRLPLRASMMALLAMAWVLESPGDAFAAGNVITPWRVLGALLWAKLSLTIESPELEKVLVFSGFDLLALLLFAVVIHRHATRSSIDRAGWVDAPRPISTFAWLSLGAVVWLSFFGLATGGSFRFALWQSIRWLYIPIVYFLMRQALRGPQDILLVARVVLGVGLFRAIEAIVVRQMFPSKLLQPHATTHHDSVLFATCVAILAANVLEAPSKKTVGLAAGLLPVFAWAMSANNRRLVWAEVMLVLVFFWLVSAWRPLKVKLARMLALLLLPLLLYAAVGWNTKASIFAPVQKVRSMVDSKADTSTLWRDLENYNLIYTFSRSPFIGAGFGHPFVEKIKLPDVTQAYELEPYVPHNSVLGIWAFAGLLAFPLLWMVFPVGMFFTLRAYRWARTPLERVAALGAAAVQICYLVQGYGDLGFGTWGPVFTVATSYALVGKICVASGGWNTAVGRRAAAARAARRAAPGAPTRVPRPEAVGRLGGS